MKAATRDRIRYQLGSVARAALFCSLPVGILLLFLLIGWVVFGAEPVSAEPAEFVVHLPLIMVNPIDAATLQIPMATMPKGYWLLDSRRLSPSAWMHELGARDGWRTRWWDAAGEAIITTDTWVFLEPVGTMRYIDEMQEKMTRAGAIFLRPEDDHGVETLSYAVGMGQGINYTSLLRIDSLLAVVHVMAINGSGADGESILWAMTSGQAVQLLAVAQR